MTLSMRPLTDAVVGAGREALAVGAAVAHYRRRFEVPVPLSTPRGDVEDATGGARARLRPQRWEGVVQARDALLAAAGFSEVRPSRTGSTTACPRSPSRIAEERSTR